MGYEEIGGFFWLLSFVRLQYILLAVAAGWSV